MKDIIIQVLKGYSTDSEDKPNTSIDFDRIESLADDLIIALKKDLSNQSVSDEEMEVCNEDFLDSFLKYVDKTTWGKDKDVTNSQVINHFLINYPPIKEQTKEWYKCDICGKDRYLNTTTPLEGLCVCPKKKVKGSDFDTKYTFQKQFIYCKENGICHEIEEGRTFHCFKFDNICSSKTCTHLRKELKDKEETCIICNKKISNIETSNCCDECWLKN